MAVHERSALHTTLMPSGSRWLLETSSCVSVLFEERPRPKDRRYCLRSPSTLLPRSSVWSAVDVESMRERPDESSIFVPTPLLRRSSCLIFSLFSQINQSACRPTSESLAVLAEKSHAGRRLARRVPR